MCVVIFFFQAEDGIRDIGVTGVQTCALPICTEGWPAGLYLAGLSLRNREDKHDFIASFGGSDRYIVDLLGEEVMASLPEELRSEERRVGKECRSRWSPYH